jgi:AcrR family transcriptional regulator
MARPIGSSAQDHDERRSALLAAIAKRLVLRDCPQASMRELASAAGVTVPTLRHYFGKRDDLIFALLVDLGSKGAPHIERVARVELPFRESIADYVNYLRQGFRVGLAEIHTIGLREGLRQQQLGPAYLNAILEPSIQALEARLRVHQAKGEMRACDERIAALQLLSPLLIVFLHQDELCGTQVRPLDIDAYCTRHIDNFLRSFSA